MHGQPAQQRLANETISWVVPVPGETLHGKRPENKDEDEAVKPADRCWCGSPGTAGTGNGPELLGSVRQTEHQRGA